MSYLYEQSNVTVSISLKMARLVIFVCMCTVFGIAKIIEGDYLEEFEDRCNNQRDPENNRCSLLGGLCCLKVACNKTFCCDENWENKPSEHIRCVGGMGKTIGKCVDERFEDERLDHWKVGKPLDESFEDRMEDGME